MGKTERKKELLSSYQERPQEGGVCLISNRVTGRVYLLSARDVRAQENRFRFSLSTGTPLLPAMSADFAAHGPASFTFQVAESLTKGTNRTDKEFRSDLRALEDMWREKLRSEGIYFY